MNRNAKFSLISLAVGFVATAAWAAPPPQGAAASGTAISGVSAQQGSGGVNRASGLNIPIQIPQKPPRPRLSDLTPPDVRTVMSAEQLAAAIPNPDETESAGPETVQVRSGTPPPYVPSGFAALYWAATHPTQSWRILTPVQ